MTSIGYEIPQGAPIPADVTAVRDRDGDIWHKSQGVWRSAEGVAYDLSGDELSHQYGPLEVRVMHADRHPVPSLKDRVTKLIGEADTLLDDENQDRQLILEGLIRQLQAAVRDEA